MSDLAWPYALEPESRFTQPTARCPHPERWHSTDDDSTELEVTELAATFVRALQPDVVVETGTAWGQTAEMIGYALSANGHGHLYTFETDPERAVASRERCEGLPVTVIQRSSLEGLSGMQGLHWPNLGSVGFAWLDSLFDLRVEELRLVRPLLRPGAVVGIHDCGEPGHAKFDAFSHQVAAEADRLGFSRISLPTPRGVTFLGWAG